MPDKKLSDSYQRYKHYRYYLYPVNLQVIDQSIDTGDATGRVLFNMLGAIARPLLRSIAQFETEIRAERQMDGIRNAKARGVSLGRKRKKEMTDQECLELRQKRTQGVLIKTLMGEHKLSKASVYRYLDGVKVLQSLG